MIARAATSRPEAAAPPALTYDAFISYRRAEPDATIARRLHVLLETYRTPRYLVARGVRPRLRAVFRDVDDLAANPDLAAEIERVLETSRFLVVVCSPRSHASTWVAREVESFLALGRADRILLLLIEGEPAESFPAALGGPDALHQPLAADVRAASTREMLARLDGERLRLLAAMLDCRYDDLKQRELERTVRRLWMLAAVLLALLGGAALAIWQVVVSRSRAEQRTVELLVEQARTDLASGEYASARDRIEEVRAHGTVRPPAFGFLAARAREMRDALRFDIECPSPVLDVAFTGGGSIVTKHEGRIEIRDGATGTTTATLDEAQTGAGASIVGVAPSDFFVTRKLDTAVTPTLLWNAKTAQRVGELFEEHAFDMRGTRVLSWGERGLRVVDLQDGSAVDLARERVTSAVFCGPSDDHVLFGTSSGALWVDTRSATVRRRFATAAPVILVAVDRAESRFAFVTRDPDGSPPRILYAEAASEQGPIELGEGLDSQGLYFATENALIVNDVSYVTVVDVASRQKTIAIGAHEIGAANALGGISADGSTFTTLGSYGVGVHRTVDGASLHELDADRFGVTFARFGPRGSFLLTGGQEGVARLWNATSGALLAAYRGFEPQVVGAFSPTGALALAGGKRLAVWDWAVGGPRATLDVTPPSWASGLDEWHPGVVGVTPSGDVLYADGGGHLKTWDRTTAPTDIAGVEPGFIGAALSLDGSTVAVWRAGSGSSEVVPLRGGTRVALEGEPRDLSFSPDGRRLAGPRVEGGVLYGGGLWDATTGTLVAKFPRGLGGVRWSPKGTLLASGGVPVTVRTASTGTTRAMLDGEASAFLTERVVATVTSSGTLRAWDAQTGALLETWRDAAGAATAGMSGTAILAVDTSGRFVAAAGSDERTLRIYDIRSRTVHHQIWTRSLRSVAFLRGGALLVVHERSALGARTTIFDVTTGRPLRVFDGAPPSTDPRLGVDPGEQRLVTERKNGIDVWAVGD